MEEYRDVTNLPSQGHTMAPLFDVNHHDVQQYSEGQHMLGSSENNDSTNFSTLGYDGQQEKTHILVNENNLSNVSIP